MSASVRRRVRDEGASSVQYAGLIVLSGVLVVAVGTAATVPTVRDGVANALCQLFSGITGAECEGGEQAGPPRPPENHTCTLSYTDTGATASVRFPVRYVDIGVGVTAAVQTTQVVRPDGSIGYDVTISLQGEGLVALPRTQMQNIDPDLYGGLLAGGSQKWEFASEADAEALPALFAERMAHDVARANLLTGPGLAVADRVPGLREAVAPPELPPVTETSGQGGIFIGGGVELEGAPGDLEIQAAVEARGALVLGGTHNHTTGETKVRMELGAEGSGSAGVNIGSLYENLPEAARNASGTAVSGAITALEAAASASAGYPVTFPPQVVTYLSDNWPNVEGAISGKITTTTELTFNDQGELIGEQRQTDIQWNFAVGADIAPAELENLDELEFGANMVLAGSRSQETETVDLSDPADREIVEDYYGQSVTTSQPDAFGDAADARESLYDREGERTRQEWDLSGGNGFIGADRNSVAADAGLTQSTGELSSAEYYDRSTGSWIPWDGCTL
ncbi:hypothetical protein [Allonocardiopsis opalescens]|uniref:Uncharacterized protein n=1 Tax=Allonocardiopsis opalescens TaxID=1144618 RepID=A0A2T0PVP7_9ACTN|nr:hypothetical protein [Allonocardiopsis opalescens]PRX95510.1 hypothetical protein CLV72_109119 [Allonocardiopsis opalescens]